MVAVTNESPTSLPNKLTLRLSVTEICNLRCSYCLPYGFSKNCNATAELDLGELAALVDFISRHFDIGKVRLTGGEPLTRPGLVPFIARLRHTYPDLNLALTTNGTLLARYAGELKQAGLDRINISLDSLDPARFNRLTGGRLGDALEGIESALRTGFDQVKLNAVLIKSTWKEEVPQLLDYAAGKNLEIRFIELMETGEAAQWAKAEYVSSSTLISSLTRSSPCQPCLNERTSPARRMLLDWKGAKVLTGWITPQSHPFCEDCNRIRLDSSGRLRRCLIDPETLSLHVPGSAQDEELMSAELFKYLSCKSIPTAMTTSSRMASVGG